jgi:hypothetical protein
MDEFKEIRVLGSTDPVSIQSSSSLIEISWDNGRLIRFQHVEQLIDFLKKVA